MDDRIRISDADRDRVTARLRDHFAEGRLTSDELEERVTAALNAKTYGELRRVMADLPGPYPPPPHTPAGPAGGTARGAAPPWARRRRPPILPLVLLGLLAVVLIPGHGWLLFAVVKFVLVLWLLVFLAGFVLAGLIRRRIRRDRWAGHAFGRHWDWPGRRERWSRWQRW